MRTKDKVINIKKVNLLMEMRDRLLNESPPWHSEMEGPVIASKPNTVI